MFFSILKNEWIRSSKTEVSFRDWNKEHKRLSVMSSSDVWTSTFYEAYKNNKFKNLKYYLVLGFDRTNAKFAEALNELDLNMVHVP